MIKTRSGAQIRSHAQKYFNRESRNGEKKGVGHEEGETSIPKSLGYFHEGSEFMRMDLPKSFINSTLRYLPDYNKFNAVTDQISGYSSSPADLCSGKQGKTDLSYLSEYMETDNLLKILNSETF